MKEKTTNCESCGGELLITKDTKTCHGCGEPICNRCHSENEGLCTDCLSELHE